MQNPKQILRNLQESALSLKTGASYHGGILKVQFTGGEVYINGKSTPFRYYEPIAGYNSPLIEITKERAIEILSIY